MCNSNGTEWLRRFKKKYLNRILHFFLKNIQPNLTGKRSRCHGILSDDVMG